jgi:hypothetical protein
VKEGVRHGRLVKAVVRLGRVAVAVNLAVSGVREMVRDRRGVVKVGARRAEAARVVRAANDVKGVRGRVAGVSISRRISISKS